MAAGVNWRSFTEEYLDSTGLFKDAVIAILAVIARLRRQGKTDHLGRPRLVLDRAQIRQLREQGQSVRSIAAELGVSHMTITRIVNAATA